MEQTAQLGLRANTRVRLPYHGFTWKTGLVCQTRERESNSKIL